MAHSGLTPTGFLLVVITKYNHQDQTLRRSVKKRSIVLSMQRDAAQTKGRHGADFNARGQQVRRVGKPIEKDDALTWSIPSYTTAERDLLPVTTTSFLLIMNTTTSKLNFYDGSAWRAVTST